jgi:hypothetical protein
VPAGTELCTRGADDLDEPAGLTAGVRGVLKGCATPGFEVAAGAPEAARGVAVVAVSAVMGVEAREGVVVKAREKVRAGVRRERQRVQIMVVGFWLGSVVVGLAWYCYAQWLSSAVCLWSWKIERFKVPKRPGLSEETLGDAGFGFEHVMPLCFSLRGLPSLRFRTRHKPRMKR